MEDRRQLDRLLGHPVELRQRLGDLFVEWRDYAIQNLRQIKQNLLPLVCDRQAFSRLLLGLPTRGYLDTDAAPYVAHVVRRQRRIQPIQQMLCDPLLLPQQRATRGLTGVSSKHRFDAQAPEQLDHFRKRQSASFEGAQRVLDPAGLRPLAVSDEVLSAASDAVDLLRQIHRLKPCGESAYQISSERRRTAAKARSQLRRGLRVAVPATNGGHAILLDHLEQGSATLLPENFADERSEGVHVIAQRLVLGREMYVAAAHEVRELYRYGSDPAHPASSTDSARSSSSGCP